MMCVLDCGTQSNNETFLVTDDLFTCYFEMFDLTKKVDESKL